MGLDYEIGPFVGIGPFVEIGLFGGTGPVVSLTYMCSVFFKIHEDCLIFSILVKEPVSKECGWEGYGCLNRKFVAYIPNTNRVSY